MLALRRPLCRGVVSARQIIGITVFGRSVLNTSTVSSARLERTCYAASAVAVLARSWAARDVRILPTNQQQRRGLSGTVVRQIAEKDDGKGRKASTTNHEPQQQQVQQQEQKPLKGIRKALSSTTAAAHENIYTLPTLLTFSRLAAAPFIGYAILHDAHALALGLFAYAGVSDLLDGWIARRYALQTVVGSVVDPMADKILMTVLTVTLAMQGALPVWLAVIILGRDVGLGVAAIYYRWISLPPPKTFTRYWDFSLPSAEVRPTTISKYNTFLQLGLMGATMVAPVVAVDVGAAMTAFQYLVATTTIWSGLSYVFSKDAVRILSENKNKKEL
ncbi:CDP-alcohol phosphatidyltransferase-domain-containing protein [Xylariaceae sp. FL0594]|nr:CDP-alcohol phosphatidyltransferase-domain-containing protein [Xylariaceae sp. FL0594]